MDPQRLVFDIPASVSSAHRLVCWEWGKSDSHDVALCVHGLTRNGRDFDIVAQALAADGWRVLCPDIAGRGESQWLLDPAGYINPAYLSDIAFILGHLGISRVAWIGTSMGGILGIMAANTFPNLLSGLALNDVGCFIPAASLQRIKEIGDVQTVFKSREEAEAAFRRRTATFGIKDEAHWQHLLRYAIEQTLDANWRFTYDPAIFMPGRDVPVTDVNLWPFWEAVKQMPVLLVRGAQSDILPRTTAQEMQAQHPRLTLYEVADAGHAPALMAGDQVETIRKWIQSSG